ncbi:MAG: FadR family transcriptional regulator [Burkholderiales bacterium]|jgi:DNA-binding FadR family transcriptional regulator|nr:FadR family transcriptional regulator [Burkholderiales bacterium]ODU69798.1 MAG: GntR family transcriptional regulator [Lautropia sp. SCN 66-9]
MSSTPDFQRVKAIRVSDDIALQIRAQIAAGRLQVGSRLPSERILAEQFGVSRNTLREALRSLEHGGLIRLQTGVRGGAVIQNGGSSAIGSTLMDMYHLGGIKPQDLTQARIMYESAIIRVACEKATAEDIAALSANIDAAEQARRDGDFEARIRLHLEFHRMLARIAGNPITMAVMNGVLDIMAKFIASIPPYDNSFIAPSRRRFLKHFAAGDADAAVAEMEASLKRLEKKYLSQAPALEMTPPR